MTPPRVTTEVKPTFFQGRKRPLENTQFSFLLNNQTIKTFDTKVWNKGVASMTVQMPNLDTKLRQIRSPSHKAAQLQSNSKTASGRERRRATPGVSRTPRDLQTGDDAGKAHQSPSQCPASRGGDRLKIIQVNSVVCTRSEWC